MEKSEKPDKELEENEESEDEEPVTKIYEESEARIILGI